MVLEYSINLLVSGFAIIETQTINQTATITFIHIIITFIIARHVVVAVTVPLVLFRGGGGAGGGGGERCG
jgi:hypothetical protein